MTTDPLTPERRVELRGLVDVVIRTANHHNVDPERFTTSAHVMIALHHELTPLTILALLDALDWHESTLRSEVARIERMELALKTLYDEAVEFFGDSRRIADPDLPTRGGQLLARTALEI